MPSSVDEVKNLSRDELKLVIAPSYAIEIRPSSIRARRASLGGREVTSGEREVLARVLAEAG